MAARLTALVTGGASGLGRATALNLAARGMGVVVADITNETDFEDSNIRYAQTDVTSETDVTRALDLARAEFGSTPFVAVNCAGIGYAKRTISSQGEPHDLAGFLRVMNVNAVGSFNVLRLAAMRMMETAADEEGQRGVIINTASIAAYEGQVGQAAYAASKGAIVSMTLPCARDLAASGIRVCAIAPGLFMTPLLEGLPELVRTQLASTVPNPPRLGRAEEFAHLVGSIIDNKMLNGEVIRLDGALRMGP
ncbi:unnamed protein product [Ectocarpus fasciculatus]